MASKPTLFVRILLAVIHKIWAVLFFLVSLSVVSLVNHYWPFLVDCYRRMEALGLMAIDYMNSI